MFVTIFLKSNLEEEEKQALYYYQIFQESLGLTNFRLDIGVCIDNAMILIIKYLLSLFMISFNELLKGTTILQYVMCDAQCLMFQT